jgi:glycerol kinase
VPLGFYNLVTRGWDDAVLEAMRIPREAIATLVDSSAPLGRITADGLPPLMVSALVGDQQSAMMGQLRVRPGEVKISYGTAAMLDLNAGHRHPLGRRRRVSTGALAARRHARVLPRGHGDHRGRGDHVAPRRPRRDRVAGRERHRRRLGARHGRRLGDPRAARPRARRISSRPRAPVVGGISRATTRAHIVRAVIEGVAWRCREVYEALRADCPHPAPQVLRADGGMARNDVLLQAQADFLGIPVERPAVLEAAALGAAYLAGLATGVVGRQSTTSRVRGSASASSSRGLPAASATSASRRGRRTFRRRARR